jgi:hypothetical protein
MSFPTPRGLIWRTMPSQIAHDGDEELIAALRRGEAHAFATLVDRHSPAMIRVARCVRAASPSRGGRVITTTRRSAQTVAFTRKRKRRCDLAGARHKIS